MVFTDPTFLFIFLPALLVLYFLPGPFRHLRNPLLVLASLFFYAWGGGIFVLMMVLSITFNYYIGLWIDKQKSTGNGKWPVSVGIIGNLTFLALFKYANFIVLNFNALLIAFGAGELLIEQPNINLPIGISFFTLQAMSYVIDVYRGNANASRNPINIALYISLFPQLIAGPIVRYKDIAAQIVTRRVDCQGFAEGVRRFIIGLGKKVIIADTCARTVDMIFGVAANPEMPGVPLEHLTTSLAWVAIIGYSLQIYFDFSGYSDMAIGLGRMFGFRFLENFNYPYISQSITEFWKRWHISLSSWFRDYLYIPLGGNRGGERQTYRNLALVFLLCGLWHGASWNFIIWGLFHGGLLVLERAALTVRLEKTFRPLRHLYVLAIVLSGWVLFRVETLPQTMAVLSALVGMAPGDGILHSVGLYVNREFVLAVMLGIVGSTPLWPALKQWHDNKVQLLQGRQVALFEGVTAVFIQSALVLVLLLSSLMVGAGSYSPFIYFRF
jgi:alginate O-acetyltransferase complex protein AlgI